MKLRIEARENEKVKYLIDGVEIKPPHEYYIKVSSVCPIEFWLTSQFKLQVAGDVSDCEEAEINGKKVNVIKGLELVGIFFK